MVKTDMSYGKLMRKVLAIVLLLVMVFPVSASADAPYKSYNQTKWKNSVPAPDAYEAVRKVEVANLGIEGIEGLKDFCFDDRGQLYVLESSGKIIIFDNQLNTLCVIPGVKNKQGESDPLKSPSGIFTDGRYIYIADTGNSRGLKINLQGNIEVQYLKPEDNAYTSTIYQPVKILADSTGMVYVLSEGVYQGVILFDAGGAFTSFYGSAPIQVNARVVIDRIWKGLMTKSQREKMAQYVPVSFTNFDIDEKGFIYTCSYYTNNNKEQIRRLNYLGKNIYPYKKDFGEKETVYYKGNVINTNFTDIEITDENTVLALDMTRGRVYAFDQEGNRLFNFGTIGAMKGAFVSPAAVESYNRMIYVLDSGNSSITLFRPTQFGSLMLKAVSLYTEGQYLEALQPWQELLALNSNFELAYTGIGESLMKLGRFKEAVSCFRQGFELERESKAFKQYRAQVLRENMPIVVTGFLLLVTLLLIITNRRFLAFAGRKLGRDERPLKSEALIAIRYMGRITARPIETLEEMKYKRYQNYGFTGVILLVLFAVEILSRQQTGFRFNQHNPEELNIFIQLSFTALLFILFAAANWGVCSIMEGEGRFGEIVTVCAYALCPYILFRLCHVGLSRISTLEEQAFLSVFMATGILWSLFLGFQAIRIVHQYTSGKTVLIILLSCIGVAVILFVLFLLFALFRQIYAFGYSVYSELIYRS